MNKCLVLFLAPLLILTIFCVNFYRKTLLIDQEQQVVNEALNDITEYERLGFSQQDPIINLYRQRMRVAEERIKKLRMQWIARKVLDVIPHDQSDHLAHIIALNKKILHSYTRDMQDYKKLGVPEESVLVQFTKKHMMQLALVLKNFEKQKQLFDNKRNLGAKKVIKIKDIISLNQQAINHYKQELYDYNMRGIDKRDVRIRFAQKKINEKAQAIEALEYLLR